MRKILLLTGLSLLICAPSVYAASLVDAARERTTHNVTYNGAYMRLTYPGGDVPDGQGVCTDVIVRSYRNAHSFDLQKAVHEDMKANFSAYPKIWGLTRTDRNIDHRRVPNLEKFFKRRGASLAITQNSEDYKPGDVVSWRLGGNLPHIGIVSDKKSASGTPLIIHNIGAGTEEDDMLFGFQINGHYRFVPKG